MIESETYAVCKEECGSINTTFYKHRKYRYEYANTNLFEVKVYNEIGKYVFFFTKEFKEYFFSDNELRKEKLKRLKNYE
jgi:hypothetical protein